MDDSNSPSLAGTTSNAASIIIKQEGGRNYINEYRSCLVIFIHQLEKLL